MTFYVMDADERKLFGKSDCLGLGNSHKKRSHKAGTVGYRNRRQIGKSTLCLRKSCLYYGIDLFDVLTGCDLRNYTALKCVKVDLGIYDI